MEKLNRLTKQFSEDKLKQNLDNDSDLTRYRQVCNELTQFCVGGSKTMTMIRKFDAGEKDHLMKTSINTVPNRLNEDTITDVEQKMQTYTESLNAVLCNATLNAFQKDLHKTEQTCLKENPKIVAKAWRTVKLSNQNEKEPKTDSETQDDSILDRTHTTKKITRNKAIQTERTKYEMTHAGDSRTESLLVRDDRMETRIQTPLTSTITDLKNTDNTGKNVTVVIPGTGETDTTTDLLKTVMGGILTDNMSVMTTDRL